MKLLDKGRGHDPRSLFIRQAVAEKLTRMGLDVPDGLVFAPDRASRLAESDNTDSPPVHVEKKKIDYKEALKAESKARKKAAK